jgi:response regulator RpfG family c-di-GMP phosphodiesterase
MIVDGAGAHFDPALVKAFLACENEFLSIRQRFATGDEAVPMDEMAA